jgi:hypothetical protein
VLVPSLFWSVRRILLLLIGATTLVLVLVALFASRSIGLHAPLVPVGLFVLHRNRHRRQVTADGGGADRPRRGSLILLAVASVVLSVAAGLFAYDWAMPLHVRTWNAELTRIASCAEHRSAMCPQRGRVAVPGLGAIGPSGFWYEHGFGNPSSLSITAGNGASAVGGPGTWGYIYQPGATVDTLSGDTICVRHLFGPWWEYGGPTPNCPFGGYTFIEGP